MRKMKTVLGLLALTAIFGMTAWMKPAPVSSGIGPEGWAGYQKWYKVTKEPNTGDPTGFLQKRHLGNKAYRDIFINSIGEAVNKSMGPYNYPEGTIIVKEAFKNKKAYDAKKKPVLTIMIKLAEGKAPDTGDWEFIMGASGKKRGAGLKTKWGKFCGNCHVYAAGSDYAFINSKFLSVE